VSDESLSSQSKKRDQELGMHTRITRRDFLNGVALTIGAAIIPPEMQAAAASDLQPQDVPGYYPPAKTGLRGSHPGSFETMHSVRDGDFWNHAPRPVDTGESYDLVIVGGGISGLAAAHFFRKAAGDGARVLILEKPRRLRRPRQAQRISRRQSHLARLRRHLLHRKPRPIQPSCKSPYRRAWHRRSLVSQIRKQRSLPIPRPQAQNLFRQGNIWRRPLSRQCRSLL